MEILQTHFPLQRSECHRQGLLHRAERCSKCWYMCCKHYDDPSGKKKHQRCVILLQGKAASKKKASSDSEDSVSDGDYAPKKVRHMPILDTRHCARFC